MKLQIFVILFSLPLLNVNLRFGVLSFITGRWKIEDADISNNFTSFNTNLRLSNLSFRMEFKF